MLSLLLATLPLWDLAPGASSTSPARAEGPPAPAPVGAAEPRQLSVQAAPRASEEGVSLLRGPLPPIVQGSPQATLGGSAGTSQAAGTGIVPPPGIPNLYDLTLTGTGTGWVEDFLLYVPGVVPPATVPLLVVFHQGNASHRDAQFSTDFIAEAEARGWYLLAPLGATQINFSSLDSQINTKFVLDWVLENFNVDRERIYGVGFSMGGGNVMNYAARHLDRTGGMFAALVNHTGSVSLTDTYRSDASARPYLDFLFGGPPSEQLFAYQRSSVIDIDVDGQIVPGFDLARNLAHLPILSLFATNDPVAYLPNQTVMLHEHLSAMGAPHELLIVPWIAHLWWVLDESSICNWLSTHELVIPDSGSGLVDHSGAYMYLELLQDQENAFSRFSWVVSDSLNRFSLGATENLARVTLHTRDSGLDPDQPLEVVMGTQDGLADSVVLTDYPQAPLDVRRDGQPTSSWVWQASTQSVVLEESDGGYHLWEIIP